MVKKKVAILGSTGSIGCQALEVIAEQIEKFEVEVLTANNNAELLIEQALKFKPNAVVICNEEKYDLVESKLSSEDIKVFVGVAAIEQVVTFDSIDIVLTAMVGFSGLKPTIAAIQAGKSIALANKETLVVAGNIITELAIKHNVKIYPVDSEHSAIYQCLQGEFQNPIEKIILTASGGPFRGKDLSYLKGITKKDALKHPNWDMGAKITIDSASLMNKGLEMIEAMWLFDLKPEQIEVIVHPQSIIHSIVQFTDGSMKAQMGLPDMKLPIQYALAYPQRLKNDFERFDFVNHPNLTFEKPNTEVFRNLELAKQAMIKGGNMPCIINAANEVVVQAFLEDKIPFVKMPDVIEKCMKEVDFIQKPTLEDYMNTDMVTRELALKIVEDKKDVFLHQD
ncbi:MAG: 1-deoxy-D-xylulose-5-phosphate reductoisomerase [Bacteroidia bacterium]|nr:1-deoxy-D-xylulose-5-phosphate reductoisomerase [Bacteroidia bacterium]